MDIGSCVSWITGFVLKLGFLPLHIQPLSKKENLCNKMDLYIYKRVLSDYIYQIRIILMHTLDIVILLGLKIYYN